MDLEEPRMKESEKINFREPEEEEDLPIHDFSQVIILETPRGEIPVVENVRAAEAMAAVYLSIPERKEEVPVPSHYNHPEAPDVREMKIPQGFEDCGTDRNAVPRRVAWAGKPHIITYLWAHRKSANYATKSFEFDFGIKESTVETYISRVLKEGREVVKEELRGE